MTNFSIGQQLGWTANFVFKMPWFTLVYQLTVSHTIFYEPSTNSSAIDHGLLVLSASKISILKVFGETNSILLEFRQTFLSLWVILNFLDSSFYVLIDWTLSRQDLPLWLCVIILFTLANWTKTQTRKSTLNLIFMFRLEFFYAIR